MDDDTFTELAKADFTAKLIGGLIAGTIGVIVGIVLIVFGLVRKSTPIAVTGIALIFVGVLVGVIDGIILFGRKNKSK